MAEVVPYPFLSSTHLDNIQNIMHRDLVASSNDARALVCYGFKQSGKAHFISQQEAQENGWSIEFVEKLAMDALEKRVEPEWESQIVNYGGQQHTLLIRTGDDLTSSSILRKQLLTEIQGHFGTPSVGFGVPNRNTIIAGAVPEAILQFLNQKYHDSASNGFHPVSDMVYLVRNGKVLAAAPMPDNMPAPIPSQPVASAEAPASAPRASGKKKLKAPSGRKKLRSGSSSRGNTEVAVEEEDAGATEVNSRAGRSTRLSKSGRRAGSSSRSGSRAGSSSRGVEEEAPAEERPRRRSTGKKISIKKKR